MLDMTPSSEHPEHKPLVMAWIATVLTVVVFGGILLLVLTGRTASTPVTTNGDQSFTGLASSGEGRATGTPDLAEVTLGVESRAATPNEAAAQNAAKAAAIVTSTRDSGVKPEDVQTLSVSLNPEYSFSDDGAPKVEGYIASNTVRVTVRSVDAIGKVIDAAVTAGASTVQGVFFSFTPETLRKLEDEARKQAVQDAQRRATVLAQNSNVRLGKPSSISESLTSPSQPPIYFAQAEDVGFGGGPTTPVESGTLEVVIRVDVTYEIQ